jgi:hypothetical protein
MELPFPYAQSWAKWPARYDSMDELVAEYRTIWNRDDIAPSGYALIGGLSGGRFVVMRRCVETLPDEFVVGSYLMDLRWQPLASFPNRIMALWCREQWARLNNDALLKAVWIHHARSVVPAVWVPREARVWDGLGDDEQLQVWRLISSGAPGRVVEVIEAARACGLF